MICPKCNKKMKCLQKDDYANYYVCRNGCKEIFVVEKVKKKITIDEISGLKQVVSDNYE